MHGASTSPGALASRPNGRCSGACLAVGVAATLSLVTSYVFIGVVGGAVIGWLAMRLSLSIRILRRRASFSDQLPDMLQLIASTLQAGFSLPQALDAVIRQENQPAAGEFSRALAEARIGADLDTALEAVAIRMDSDDMRWTVMAIRIQQGVGGNLAEVLLTIADTIRERAYLRRQVARAQRRGQAVRLHPRGAAARGRDVAVCKRRYLHAAAVHDFHGRGHARDCRGIPDSRNALDASNDQG